MATIKDSRDRSSLGTNDERRFLLVQTPECLAMIFLPWDNFA